jgi:YgiT-type zinc finger domain-containing protein
VRKEVTKIQTWRGKLVGVIENVPAWVCNQCNEKYFDGVVLEKIDSLLRARPKPRQLLRVPAYEL